MILSVCLFLIIEKNTSKKFLPLNLNGCTYSILLKKKQKLNAIILYSLINLILLSMKSKQQQKNKQPHTHSHGQPIQENNTKKQKKSAFFRQEYGQSVTWNHVNTRLVEGLRICWLYPLLRDPAKKWFLGYDIKLHQVVRLNFWSIPSSTILPSSPVR